MKIEKIIANPFLIGIIMLKDIIEIITSVLHQSKNNLIKINLDWWDFSIKLFIATFLWLILRAYFKLKNNFDEQIKVFGYISFIRNRRLFVKSFENIEYYRLPNETDEELNSRLPDGGLFKKHFFEEYQLVKKELQNNLMKDKTSEEIDVILLQWYPFKKQHQKESK